MPNSYSVIVAVLAALGPFAGMAANTPPAATKAVVVPPPTFVLVPRDLVVIAEHDPVFPGLQLSAHTDKDTYQPGEPISLSATLTNTSSQQVPLGGGAYDFLQFNIIARNAVGHSLPLSAYGRQLLAIPQSVYRNPVLALNSGQSRDYQFELNRMFSMSKPGTYSVIIKRQIDVYKYTDRPHYSPTGQKAYRLPDVVYCQVISNWVTVKVEGGQP